MSKQSWFFNLSLTLIFFIFFGGFAATLYVDFGIGAAAGGLAIHYYVMAMLVAILAGIPVWLIEEAIQKRRQ